MQRRAGAFDAEPSHWPLAPLPPPPDTHTQPFSRVASTQARRRVCYLQPDALDRNRPTVNTLGLLHPLPSSDFGNGVTSRILERCDDAVALLTLDGTTFYVWILIGQRSPRRSAADAGFTAARPPSSAAGPLSSPFHQLH